MLDTNAVIDLLNRASSAVAGMIQQAVASNDAIAVSSIVMAELYYGAAKGARPAANQQRLDLFLRGPVDVLPFDHADAREAGLVRAALAVRGLSIGPYDTLIAGQARRHGATLVTNNRSEFARVEGLLVEGF